MSSQTNFIHPSWVSEWIPHPLVGHFRRRSLGDWKAHTTVHGIDYPIWITAHGNEPTKAQMDRFAELVERLPEIITSSNLPDAPTQEWRNKHPDYRLLNAQILSLILYEDGSFFVRLIAFPEDDWGPGFDVSPDFKVTLAEWGV
ncbi:hypothetical protein ACO0LG_09075 [Undibacterium sp. Ji42W]|uniref:hypothetical protein n=1 Tax=Undibacterium sp. Ji42W TaxID=3413039 RepID=UPI003BF2F207